MRAVALGGSRTGPFAAPDADLDVYVYAEQPIPLDARRAIVEKTAAGALFDASPWEPGDVWVDRRSGLTVDVMYRAPDWIEAQLDRILVRHEPSLGYSTALWHNVLTARQLADADGWFAALRCRVDVAYPEPLRRAIVALNHPLLRERPFAYLRQIEAAVNRGDGVAVQHRLTALLASLFDALFALNRLPHPGEKRLVPWVEATCPLRPLGFGARLDAVLVAAAPPADRLVPLLDAMIDEIDGLLAREGLDRRS